LYQSAACFADAEAEFVGALTDLLRSIGTAVQKHEEVVSKSFGKDMTWKVPPPNDSLSCDFPGPLFSPSNLWCISSCRANGALKTSCCHLVGVTADFMSVVLTMLMGVGEHVDKS